MQLISTNLGGNLHLAAATINRMGLASFVIGMYSRDGSTTIVVLRVPDNMAPELRRHLNAPPEHCKNPVPEIDWDAKAKD